MQCFPYFAVLAEMAGVGRPPPLSPFFFPPPPPPSPPLCPAAETAQRDMRGRGGRGRGSCGLHKTMPQQLSIISSLRAVLLSFLLSVCCCFLSIFSFFHSLFCISFFRAFLVYLFRVLCVSVCCILLRVFNLPGCFLSFLICFLEHDFVLVIFCCMRLGDALLQGLRLATPQATPEESCPSGLVCRSFVLGLVPFFCVLRWPLLYDVWLLR